MKKYPAALLITALSLTLASCGNGGGGGGEQGGEFDIAWNSQPPSLDPLMTTANATRDIARNMYEPVLTFNADGQVEPVLAESYEMINDDKTVQLKIREDVPFHNGETMTADDVVASIKRWQEKSFLGSTYFSDAEVETTADGHIEISFPEPMPSAPLLMSEQNQPLVVMPASVIEAEGEAGVSEHIGTGPYKLDEWSTDQYVRFTKFAEYSSPAGETSGTAGQKNPHFDTLTYHLVSDSSTRVAGLQSGEYDAAVNIPWDNADMVQDNQDIDLQVNIAGLSYAVLNSQEGVLADPLMRKAVSAALNPSDVLQAAFVQDDFYSTSTSLMPESHKWFRPFDDAVRDNTDPSVVEELLDEAGYGGEPITMLVARDFDHLYNTSIMIQQQLKSAGIKTELVVTDYATVDSMRGDLSSWNIISQAGSWRGLPNSHSFMSPSFPGRADSPEMDQAMEDLLMATTDDESIAALSEVHKAFYADIPSIKFGDYVNITGINDDFTGHGHTELSGEIFYNVRPAEQ